MLHGSAARLEGFDRDLAAGDGLLQMEARHFHGPASAAVGGRAAGDAKRQEKSAAVEKNSFHFSASSLRALSMEPDRLGWKRFALAPKA
jgi:hypothetical protein